MPTFLSSPGWDILFYFLMYSLATHKNRSSSDLRTTTVLIAFSFCVVDLGPELASGANEMNLSLGYLSHHY